MGSGLSKRPILLTDPRHGGAKTGRANPKTVGEFAGREWRLRLRHSEKLLRGLTSLGVRSAYVLY
jgi:hypothetical protein